DRLRRLAPPVQRAASLLALHRQGRHSRGEEIAVGHDLRSLREPSQECPQSLDHGVAMQTPDVARNLEATEMDRLPAVEAKSTVAMGGKNALYGGLRRAQRHILECQPEYGPAYDRRNTERDAEKPIFPVRPARLAQAVVTSGDPGRMSGRVVRVSSLG